MINLDNRRYQEKPTPSQTTVQKPADASGPSSCRNSSHGPKLRALDFETGSDRGFESLGGPFRDGSRGSHKRSFVRHRQFSDDMIRE